MERALNSWKRESTGRITKAAKYRKDNKSGFRGVFRTANVRYRVSIGFRGSRIYMGSYSDYDEAVRVRLDAEDRIYGEFLEAYRQSLDG